MFIRRQLSIDIFITVILDIVPTIIMETYLTCKEDTTHLCFYDFVFQSYNLSKNAHSLVNNASTLVWRDSPLFCRRERYCFEISYNLYF